MGEHWKSVPGFEGRYEVSSEGRVRSLLRGGRVLKPAVNRKRGGYRQVNLQGGLQRRVCVLVAAAFLGPRSTGQQVRHLNGVTADDRADNLAYGTAAQNTQDRIAHGRTFSGERHPNARLTYNDVAVIRTSKDSRADLAAAFGVSRRHIDAVLAGRRW